MNRKIFISLIALPVALFFVSTVLIGASAPEKSRKALPAKTVNVQLTEALAAGKELIREKRCLHIEEEMKADTALAAAQKNTILQNRNYYEHKDNHRFVQRRDESVSKEFTGLVERMVLRPLKRSRIEGYSRKAFSRCPSGFSFRLVQAPGQSENWVPGQILHMNGCRGRVYTSFRIEKNSGEAELLVSEKFGYVTIQEWIRLRKLG